jgi:Uma2 family endonuclease
MSIASTPRQSAKRVALEVREHRLVLHDVPWETYQELRESNPSVCLRMTFDRGDLEIMSPSRKHEKISHRLGLMIHEWAMLHQIAAEGGGSTTFSRQDLLRGLEPDHCFWIANCAAVMDKDEIDLSIDPPPDLALEADVTRSSIPKLPIYQSLGVPEIWRWQSDTLEVLVLDDEGRYVTQATTKALPGFPLRLAEEFVGARGENKVALMHRFRKAIADMRQQ